MAVAGAFYGEGVAARVCKLLDERGHVRDGVCGGVLSPDICHAGVGGFAGFGEGIVAGVEVFAFLLKLYEVNGSASEGLRASKIRTGKA